MLLQNLPHQGRFWLSGAPGFILRPDQQFVRHFHRQRFHVPIVTPFWQQCNTPIPKMAKAAPCAWLLAVARALTTGNWPIVPPAQRASKRSMPPPHNPISPAVAVTTRNAPGYAQTQAPVLTCTAPEVPTVSTPHAGRLEGASDRPEFEAIRPKIAPVATHCKYSTCRSVTGKD